MRIKAEAFVESAKVIGAGHWRIMTRHVLPQLDAHAAADRHPERLRGDLSPSPALGFLGFGIQPTAAAEWGYDLGKSLSDVTSGIWWTSLLPGLAIVLVVLGLTLVGESLNDLADPGCAPAAGRPTCRPTRPTCPSCRAGRWAPAPAG